MEDFNFWWYIIAAVIYFLTRSKKKKSQQKQSRPGSENNPTPQSPQKTFEELLREITGESTPEPVEQTPVEIVKEEPKQEEKKEEPQRLGGERRAFADDESRRIYEESIKQAEGFDIEYGPDEHFKEPRLFKYDQEGVEEETSTLADEIREGLKGQDVQKAIIYSEILNRKY